MSEYQKRLLIYIAIAGGLIYWLAIFSLPPAAVGTWDQVDFILGVEQFDLLNMQPHFPGYPFFILGGMLMNVVTENAELALSLWNKIIYLSAWWPLFKIAEHFLPRPQAALTATVVHILPFPLIMMQQPISESMAAAVFFWMIWSLLRAFNSGTRESGLLPMVLFAVLLGVRLSYLAVGASLLVYWVWYWRKSKDWQGIIFQLAILMIANLIWVSALIANAGSLKTFFDIAIGFTEGHFTDWGGTALASDASTIERLSYFLTQNLFWKGVFVEQGLFAVSLSALLILSAVSFTKKKADWFAFSMIIAFISYFLWALFAQNIEKPRHSLPLIMLLPLLVLCFSEWKNKLIIAFSVFVLCLEIGLGWMLVKQQANEQPAVIQASAFLQKESEPFIIYTWEETRVFDYQQVSFSHKRVFTYKNFLADLQMQAGKKVYITNKVKHGFEAQTGKDLSPHVKAVDTFHSEELFDPVYNKVMIYQWIPSGGEEIE
ncbi:hypothetical protein JOC78_001844 [Bacillus ectoiniformans]|uniref:hypothetical protein n=1 Tax=Bacillus ectoiniformans TaxID=1494429 RepID=UPI00195E3384|nr:hypothetical protein [Bacillus ectoiniformans]MBM7648894.1 hypothetical protein [Bacillus ectoiniformans]